MSSFVAVAHAVHLLAGRHEGLEDLAVAFDLLGGALLGDRHQQVVLAAAGHAGQRDAGQDACACAKCAEVGAPGAAGAPRTR